MSTTTASPKAKRKTIVFIQGNISSGKSTLIKNLRTLGHIVYEEPVDRWLNEYIDENGTNSLELFYQMLSMHTRYEKIKEALEHESQIVFIERSLETDSHSFALNLYENKLMRKHEWKLYNDLLKAKSDDTQHLFQSVEIHQLYLRTDPEICYERKYVRNREEEREIKLEYFKVIHQKHDDWLNNIKKGTIHIIDGNKTIDEVLLATKLFITDKLERT
jgi:thymidine kinase